MTNNTHTTREGWLNAALPHVKAIIEEHGWKVPGNLQLSVGWPKGSGEAIGQCYSKGAAHDGETWNIFIAPDLTDPARVLDVLLHELIHATVGLEEKHSGQFKKLAQLCGLTGKMTATVAGDRLQEQLNAIVEELGPYPHVGMHKEKKAAKRGKGKTCTMVSTTPGLEDYKLAIERRFLEYYGAPLDPAGNPLVESVKGG
jgi:hypothetical protein